jgi:hypothetical protein
MIISSHPNLHYISQSTVHLLIRYAKYGFPLFIGLDPDVSAEQLDARVPNPLNVDMKQKLVDALQYSKTFNDRDDPKFTCDFR